HARDDQIAWRQHAQYTVDQVLHGMLMESSNGAAIALAQRVAGSLPAFARMATARARQLGATHTVLVDPSGLDAAGQHASARDLALIASAFLKIPWLAHVAVTKTFDVPWPHDETATRTATTTTAKPHGHSLLKIFVVFLVIAYVARVLQIKRRRMLRRRAMRARRRARIETTRRQIDARYSQRMSTPR